MTIVNIPALNTIFFFDYPAAVTHNNFIYIIGGDGGHCKNGDLSIEKFNPATKEFKIIHNWLDKVPPDVNFYVMAKRIE